MEGILFFFSVLSAIFCFLCVPVKLYPLAVKTGVPKSRRVGYFVCGVVLLFPIVSIFWDGNIYFLAARNIIFLIFGIIMLFDAIVYRIAAKWKIAIEIVLALMLLIPAIEVIIKLATIKLAV